MLPTAANAAERKNTEYGSISSPHDSLVVDEDFIEVGNTSKFTATIGVLVAVAIASLVVFLAVASGGDITNVNYSTVRGFITSAIGQTSSTSTERGGLGINSISSSSTTGSISSTTTTTTSSTAGSNPSGDIPVISTTLPNFILIVADDLGWNSLGYNDEEIAFATPILTNLARKGITMGNFYAQEVCSPSRASLMTGRYPLSAGMQYGMVAANAEWGMPLDEITIAEVLKDNGYTTHMLGKWHLGYFSPLFLPTARGFDTFTGYVNGENYYWSKRLPDYPEHVDLMDSDTSCYKPYNGTDIHDYSTDFYTSHALSIIDSHPSADPLFMYLAYQAVHDPFVDYGKHLKGMPDGYLPDEILSQIHTTIKGTQRQEYVKSLYLLDKNVGLIYDKLEERALMDNTYVIFMSDNGGCFYGGGKNGPLRGSKGALFEGGIKVDSFIYSPKLLNTGMVYNGLMHVSDWFPTVMALAGITYTPDDDHPLDGVNQITGWLGGSSPRTSMLYNMYIALTDYDFNIWYNGSFAVRDARFKLMHTYDDPDYGAWYTPDTEIEGDDDLQSDNRCAQQFVSGEFTYWLFDLENDPYETTNLYYSDDQVYNDAKTKLYALLPNYEARAKTKISIHWSVHAMKVWSAAGNHILPWANENNLANPTMKSYPVYCP